MTEFRDLGHTTLPLISHADPDLHHCTSRYIFLWPGSIAGETAGAGDGENQRRKLGKEGKLAENWGRKVNLQKTGEGR